MTALRCAILPALAVFLLAASFRAEAKPVAEAKSVAKAMPVAADSPEGAPLVERLRRGGLVLYFRHADTSGMPCDRSFRIGDRAGQRNISEAGRRQSREIGAALLRLGIPVEKPVRAGPVYRARDTAELAFGEEAVAIDEALTADDYAGARLAAVLDGHRALFSAPVRAGVNRVLVGHRTPAIMVLGRIVGGPAFPEGSAIVIEPAMSGPAIRGILTFADTIGTGFHAC
ncbi:histidine phosphatase family protein [Bosea sp. AAP35]|uniref:histidine phosphatase family protein n=1 Tax=Bosea sp. AAP35 TaxID=1523417 RepID=UPI0006B9483C|nr:histidine phosphatase family protein [Bosea sp. AAP35]